MTQENGEGSRKESEAVGEILTRNASYALAFCYQISWKNNRDRYYNLS